MQWINDIRVVLNKSLKEIAQKRQGRLVFFLLYSLIFSVASLLLIYFVSAVIGYLTIDRTIDFIDVFYSQKWYWIIVADLISPIYLVIVLKFFHDHPNKERRNFNMRGLFRSINSKTLLFFLVSVVTLTVVYSFFFFNDLGLKGAEVTDLNTLLDLMGTDGLYYFEEWLHTLSLLLFRLIPLFLIIYFGFSLRNEFSLKNCWKERRSFITFFLLFFILRQVDIVAWDQTNALVIRLIGVPFAENGIPNFLALMLRWLLTAMFMLILAYFAYYSMRLTKEQKSIVKTGKLENPDLLDDTF